MRILLVSLLVFFGLSQMMQGQCGCGLSIQTSQPICLGTSSGWAQAQVTGGYPPFTYLWSNGSTSQTVYGLAAGVYHVSVTDANGCTTVECTTISEYCCLWATMQVGKDTCSQSKGWAKILPQSATGNLNYIWSTGATTQMVSGLTPGNYWVTVTDANGCTTSKKATIGNFVVNDTTTITMNTCDPSQVGTTYTTIPGNGGCSTVNKIIKVLFVDNVDTTFIITKTCFLQYADTSIVTYTTIGGCDSVVVKEIRYVGVDTTAIMAYTCDVNSVGVQTFTLQTTNGCDSLVVTTTIYDPLLCPPSNPCDIVLVQNPVMDKIVLDINRVVESGEIQYLIFDLFGRRMDSGSLGNFQAGDSGRYYIGVYDLKDGQYLLQLFHGNKWLRPSLCFQKIH